MGVALGVAFAASPAASADAIDDAWPYLDAMSQYFPYYTATVLPSPALLPGTDSEYTFDQTYSYSDVPYLYDSAQYVVTSTVDGLAYPHVGTVLDSLLLLPIVPAVGGMVGAPMFTNVSLDDPVLGFADAFTVLNGFTNTYLSDSAGVKDVLSVYGLGSLTLFEFPAVDAGGTASESGDGFAQLLAELAGITPSL